MESEPVHLQQLSAAWWGLAAGDLRARLKTDLESGLTRAEALARLQKDGLNEIPGAKSESPFAIAGRQFKSIITWVLLFAALISGILGEKTDLAAILTIVLLNAVLGFVQEYRAERSLEALRRLSSPVSRVLREGREERIPSKEIVPGDLVLLEAGDRVPADLRLLRIFGLQVDEAALTGESEPVRKSGDILENPELPLAERANMVFMGTVAVSGRAVGTACATGLETELGRIAALLGEVKKERTPLEAQLEKLGRRLVLIFLGVVALVFGAGILRGNGAAEMFMTALSLAVAAIPEGLPAVVTMTLALGVHKMAKRNVLIRRLSCVETLGAASVICSDKTGTITQNQMTVKACWVSGRPVRVSGSGYEPEGKFEFEGREVTKAEGELWGLHRALKTGALCNNASLHSDGRTWTVSGDPTEGALLTAALKAGFDKKRLEETHPLLNEIPFDSERKRMSVLRRSPGGEEFFVKGAPDILLELSKEIYWDGVMRPVDTEMKGKIQAAYHEFAGQAMRVLGLAWRKALPGEANRGAESEQNLVFLGLAAMIDPPRPEAGPAIARCKSAGIRPVMITGDHPLTALAIAREVGIPSGEPAVLSGAELNALSDEELENKVLGTSIYARVSAEHKIRIVRALKARGYVVAMTGDGVNDAPALKESGIGVAMGITGSDVTKEAADMVVTDDNFASIVSAVEEGRGIYDNILKFVNYLISSNIAEIMVLFFGLFLGRGAGNFIPLSAVQILWMNLVTDGLPALALGMDPLSPRAMARPPRNPDEAILSGPRAFKIFITSLWIAAGALAACLWGLRTGEPEARTMTLTALILLQLIRVQLVRAPYCLSLFSNPWLLAALGGSLLMQLAVIYYPPVSRFLGAVPLGAVDWGLLVLISLGVWAGSTISSRLFKNAATCLDA